ncbi:MULTISPECIES: hypothetical protein [Exiguobacterium]|uniref:Rok-like winged helix domain-containing protein n=1 Tax=Exiguobacterium TaxID=33986 RepID=UPI0003543C87|nr:MULTISPECIES: hypothetical protein [Exiguobacterium]EPE62046.1 hypothetical protein L479_01558 [Exiguobacterium sp. S17]TCI39251.1 hypothetical protein EVJ29_01010 [Exiguobacterium sp. SH4S7]TCI48065.1 hypothetical protein EVJ31_03245 [Exiguobacterium sp. SH5S32]TCI54949.1 hypothetical protein EVJ25_03240 [Exiguobacterium sp. SH1S4]TCI62960.1 hypothetical protein EVJ21_05455 [Exiguobacterium sp. SH0S2]
MESTNINEHIYRELMEIEESYRQLQRRAEYLISELSRDKREEELSTDPSKRLRPRRVNQRYPLEVYVHQVTDLLKERQTMSVRDIQMELELRYRHHISNIYQLMVKIESVNPEIKKVGRGLYTYASAEEVTTEPAHA